MSRAYTHRSSAHTCFSHSIPPFPLQVYQALELRDHVVCHACGGVVGNGLRDDKLGLEDAVITTAISIADKIDMAFLAQEKTMSDPIHPSLSCSQGRQVLAISHCSLWIADTMH